MWSCKDYKIQKCLYQLFHMGVKLGSLIREENRLMAFQNRMMKRIFGYKRGSNRKMEKIT